MRIPFQFWILLLALAASANACKKNESSAEAQMNFSLRFDTQQERLNNIGQPAVMPAGHAAQTPEFREMSVHYIELAPNAFTQLGDGAVVYHAPETTVGGENAVDFEKAAKGGNGDVIARLDLSDVPPGTYEWVRVSVTYQNYDVVFNLNNIPAIGNLNQQRGTIASFVGFNTYIKTITPRERTLNVNDDKKQGFWAFETDFTSPYEPYNQLMNGQAPTGATTVVNPLASSSPVPAGSCVVTGRFVQPLVVTGEEKDDLNITLSFSVNNSFEWIDNNGNGKLDIYADGVTPSDQIVDMGLRGLIPDWE